MKEDKLIKCMEKAKEIYALGLRMQTVFSKDDSTAENYMTMAICAGLMEFENKPLETTENFGQWCKSTRKGKGLTLRQIEDATGVSNAYLSQLENGKIKKPSQDVVAKITNFLVHNLSCKRDEYLPGGGLLDISNMTS